MYVFNVYETRDKKNKKSNVAPLGAQKNGETGLGQKAGFASVQRFAEIEPALGTRLLEERSELALKSQQSQEGCMGTVGLGKKRTIVPRGTPIGSQWLQWAFAGKPPPWGGEF
jgi:hypothetical protein